MLKRCARQVLIAVVAIAAVRFALVVHVKNALGVVALWCTHFRAVNN